MTRLASRAALLLVGTLLLLAGDARAGTHYCGDSEEAGFVIQATNTSCGQAERVAASWSQTHGLGGRRRGQVLRSWYCRVRNVVAEGDRVFCGNGRRKASFFAAQLDGGEAIAASPRDCGSLMSGFVRGIKATNVDCEMARYVARYGGRDARREIQVSIDDGDFGEPLSFTVHVASASVGFDYRCFVKVARYRDNPFARASCRDGSRRVRFSMGP